MNVNEVFIGILRAQLTGTDVSEDLRSSVTPELLGELYSVSKHHDSAHLVGELLDRCGLLPDESEYAEALRREFMLAGVRNMRMRHELSAIVSLFEKEKIPHIVLKGSVLRDLYPQTWMRTSCDIDILVSPEDLERAAEALKSKLSYTYLTECRHDVSYNSPSGVHLELHFTLIEDDVSEECAKRLENLFSVCKPRTGYEYSLVMSDADFYFYHIVHMAKHFLSGGCGVRPIMDLYVMYNAVSFDGEARRASLDGSGFSKFADVCERLMRNWFCDGEANEGTRLLAEFILVGGSYGTVENYARVGVAKNKGKLSYVMRRIFPDYSAMAVMYPVLKKHKILLPVCYVRRWLRVILGGDFKKARTEIRSAASTDESQKHEALLDCLGLQ